MSARWWSHAPLILALVLVSTLLPLRADASPESVPTSDLWTPLTFDALLAATPRAYDRDRDRVPDPVEAVYGTSPADADSDLDTLDDFTELSLGLDPLSPDSNRDGLPDGLEFEGPPDMDSDGLDNAFDPDNDNDGLRDGLDLSPFGASTQSSHFAVEVLTDGGPTYVDYQLRPVESSLLSLIAYQGDWPVDQAGTIQDLRALAGESDVRVVPMLEMRADTGPSPEELEGYGVVLLDVNPDFAGDDGVGWKALLPLNPVLDAGREVGFAGRMFYPTGFAPGTVDVGLVWAVTGPADARSDRVATDEFTEDEWTAIADQVSTGISGDLDNATQGAGCTATADEVPIEPGSNPERFKALRFTCDEPLSNGALFATGDVYEFTTDTGLVVSGSIDVPGTEGTTIIARYKSDATMTGLAATENHGSEAGIVFGDDDDIIAAALALDYLYLRSNDSLDEALDLLATRGPSGLGSVVRASIPHFDEAMSVIGVELIPEALDAMPDGEERPILMLIGDRSSTGGPQGWNLDAAIVVDVRSQVLESATRSMRLDWYDTTLGARIEDAFSRVASWDLDPATRENILALALVWSAGETVVTEVGGTPSLAPTPESLRVLKSVFDYTAMGIDGSLNVLAIGAALESGIGFYRFVSGLRSAGWSLRLGGTEVTALQGALREVQSVLEAGKSAHGLRLGAFSKISSSAKALGKVAIVLSLAVGFVEFVRIANSSGWSLEGILHGTWVFTLYAATALVFWAIAQIPYVGAPLAIIGGLILLFGELFGGWWSKVEAWWNGLWSDTTPLVKLAFDFTGQPELVVRDVDDNGFDVDDEVVFRAQFLNTHEATRLRTRFSHLWWSQMFERFTADVCIERPDGSTECMPASACLVDDGSTTCESDIVDIRGERTDLPDNVFSPPEIFSEYVLAGRDHTCGEYLEAGVFCGIRADRTASIELIPRRATGDLQLELGLAYTGQVAVEYDPLIGPTEVSFAPVSDDGSTTIQSMSLDVLPGGIQAFLDWDYVQALDADRDGLLDTVDPAVHDSDADDDGLPDGYEEAQGTNPMAQDSDGDGLPDGCSTQSEACPYSEISLGTDPLSPDTDGDGLSDLEEAQGWWVAFDYQRRRFLTDVTSNPLVPDADGDGIGDFDERLLRLNPNAADTDGDRRPDSAEEAVATLVLLTVDLRDAHLLMNVEVLHLIAALVRSMGSHTAACGGLFEFSHRLSTLVDAGRLTPSEASPLTDRASDIRLYLGC